MKRYIKNATAVVENLTIKTAYGTHTFSCEDDLNKFIDFVNSDPDYNDPDLVDIIEWAFFYKLQNNLL